jgi:carboxypeptidase PM20D1
MFKKISLSLLGILILLAVVMTIRTFMFQPFEKKPVSSIKVPIVDVNMAAEHLSKAIEFKTISTHDDNQTNANAFMGLHRFLQEKYADVFSKLEVKDFPPFGLLLKWEGKNPDLKPIMIMAHQDVVPIAPGTLDLWKHPPFSGAIDNGIIWGRGAVDDKGSLISILEGVSYLLGQGYDPERTIYLYFSDEEEILCAAADKVVQYFKDNNIHLEAVFDEGGAILSQAFTPAIPYPVAVIGLAEKGYLDLEVSTQAQGGHSATPLAQTTIGIVNKAVTKLEEDPFAPKFEGLQREFFENLGRHMGFRDRFLMANYWLFKPFLVKQLSWSPDTNAFIRTTSAATVFNAGIQSNVVPAEAKAIVNFRIIPGETVEAVLERARIIIKDPRVKIKTIKAVNPSSRSSSKTKSFDLLRAAIHALYPNQHSIVLPFVTPGVTESRHFSEVSDNQYRFLPCLMTNAEMAGFHGTNEHVSLKNLEKMIQFYIILIKEFR